MHKAGSNSIAQDLPAVRIRCLFVGSSRSKGFPLQTLVFFWNPSFLFSPFLLSSWHFPIIPTIGGKQKQPASKGSFSRGNTAAFPRLLSQLIWLSGETLVWCLKVPEASYLLTAQNVLLAQHTSSFPIRSLCFKPARPYPHPLTLGALWA